MEKLSLAITEEVQAKRWTSVKASKEGPGFSHLLVVDDVLWLCRAKSASIPFVEVQDSHLEVKDRWIEHGWKTAMLATPLLQNVIDKIHNYTAKLHGSMEDWLVWKGALEQGTQMAE
ncbi:hypothetical protein L6164_001025 [Bauhinia variegata]|uniref:Uncharacterized protein n=1 Tax=Bauhinia variegata TaxID=167791 RepID=A0ACB9QAE3_BAUVA|nr:hypothetical protein L6164_001025 [Bauhinia variegata]